MQKSSVKTLAWSGEQIMFVVLRGRLAGNVFWTTRKDNETLDNARYLSNGTLAYDVLAACDTEAEARKAYNAAIGFRISGFWDQSGSMSDIVDDNG